MKNSEVIESGDLVEIIANVNPEYPEFNHMIGKCGEVVHVDSVYGETVYYLKEFEGFTFFRPELRKIDTDISELTELLAVKEEVC